MLSTTKPAKPVGRRRARPLEALAQPLVRVRRFWRGSCEICAFFRAGAAAVLEFFARRRRPQGGS